MKKGLLLLLACLMVLPLAFACAKTPERETPAETTDAPSKEEQTTNAPEDLYAPARDLTALDYGMDEVRLLQFKVKKDEFEPQGGTGDIVEQAVYKRNDTVERDLNIIFKYVYTDCPIDRLGKLEQDLSTARNANDPKSQYHIVSQPSYYVTQLMVDGYYEDLSAIDNSYIDLTRKYWSSSYVDASVVNGRYYFVTGELCTSILDKMEVVYVNNDLARSNFENEDLLQLVYDKQWTYQKMLELVALAGAGETNGVWGMAVPKDSYSIDGMLCAMGLTMVTVNDEGVPSVNVNTQKNIDIIEKLRKLYWENESVNASGNDSVTLPLFRDGKAIFTMTLMDRATQLYKSGLDYTFIPMPLYDENQDDYIVVPQDNYSIMSICSGLKDKDKYTAVLEDLCYRSHETTYPAVYTKLYSVRLAQNDDNSKMFDFLFEHLNFDLGYIYSYVLGECKNVPRYLIYPVKQGLECNYLSGISSTLETLSGTMETKIPDFIKFFWKAKE